jgi:hypothetical protein
MERSYVEDCNAGPEIVEVELVGMFLLGEPKHHLEVV